MAALAAALKAYSFLPPPPGMLFPEHHWWDYALPLCHQIMEILIPAPATATAVPQQTPSVPTAPIVAQSVPQRVAEQPRPTVPIYIR
uniref:Uncharacterized protein n=1 Tax=Romanomermis culicivorax TaxID=13658 RepID=A0A915HHT9_ROMCU